MRQDEILEEGQPESDLDELRSVVTGLTRAYGPPSPYVAVLAADGDHMGKTISRIANPSEQRRFSRALAEFADSVERIVRDCSGALVYSGGDDVLALLPVDTAIECAHSLWTSFGRKLREWSGPTLSVGIGIGHSIGEDMEDLLRMARAAEEQAKMPDRNGLAIRWATRGGEPLDLRYQWSRQPHVRLYELVKIYLADRFPDGAAYELREMARHYEGWPAASVLLTAAVKSDALRLLSRKAVSSDPAALERIRASVLAGVQDAGSLERLAKELILARRFASVFRQSHRHPGEALP